MINEEQRVMAEYILQILSSQKIKAMSWGSHDFYPGEINGMPSLVFRVNGFIHKGLVYVSYNEGSDLFEVFTFDNNGNAKRHETDVYIESLVDTIDEMVEIGESFDEYTKKVVNEYGLKMDKNHE